MDTEGPSFVSIIRLYKLPIFFGGVSFFLIILSIVLLIKSSYSADPIQFIDRQNNPNHEVSSQSTSSAITNKIIVDIEGAVMNPGVVTVQIGSRVEDVLKEAGGLRKDADMLYIAQSINKAMKVSDGMKIYIPSQSETSHNDDCSTFQKNGDVVQSCGIVATLAQSSQNATHVSINMASIEQLDVLPGIGPVTAQKIIDNRPYQTLEELISKKVVGQSVFEKIKEQIDL